VGWERVGTAFPNLFFSTTPLRRRHWGYIVCGILDPAAVQECTKFPSLITNVLLQLVRDTINVVCHQRYEKRLEHKKIVQMLMFALHNDI